MTFAEPVYLYAGTALAALAILASWTHARRRRNLAAFLGGKRAVRRLSRGNLYRLRIERVILLVAATLAVAAAAAEPRIEEEDTPDPLRSVVLAIDVSASMQASDVEPTRLALAAEVARTLVDELEGERVGLLLFAGNAYTLAPPTFDHDAIRYFLDGVVPTIASAHDPGSLITVGVREAAALLAADGGPGDIRSIVLIGDGDTEESAEEIEATVQEARALGISVSAVGVGTEEGSGMIMPAAPYQLSGPVLDASGSPDHSSLDEAVLERLADSGGGRYAYADDGGALGDLRAELAPRGDPSAPRVDFAFVLILGALIGLVLESLLDVRLRGWHTALLGSRAA